MALARVGVNTINPQSRDSGWLEWVERGTITWDDNIAYDDVTFIEFYLNLSSRGIG